MSESFVTKSLIYFASICVLTTIPHKTFGSIAPSQPLRLESFPPKFVTLAVQMSNKFCFMRTINFTAVYTDQMLGKCFIRLRMGNKFFFLPDHVEM